MNDAAVLLPFLVGVALRLALPLGLTFGAAWLLRRLDRRWQQEADQLVTAKSGVRTGLGMIRCWVLNDCPRERRESCPAFLEAHIPCWQHFRDARGRLAEPCLGCEIFRRALAPDTSLGGPSLKEA